MRRRGEERVMDTKGVGSSKLSMLLLLLLLLLDAQFIHRIFIDRQTGRQK
jgi:hypothetical protein